jgi:hypothetical protein
VLSRKGDKAGFRMAGRGLLYQEGRDTIPGREGWFIKQERKGRYIGIISY